MMPCLEMIPLKFRTEIFGGLGYPRGKQLRYPNRRCARSLGCRASSGVQTKEGLGRQIELRRWARCPVGLAGSRTGWQNARADQRRTRAGREIVPSRFERVPELTCTYCKGDGYGGRSGDNMAMVIVIKVVVVVLMMTLVLVVAVVVANGGNDGDGGSGDSVMAVGMVVTVAAAVVETTWRWWK
ncbi:hypothetical protein ISN45_Aa03g032340 [Arabidopsis thaliana x Arabidopsis arenosa]|uniref:Transmembrane protein n=1 Tax=Arabidopsis thaliana x Arabidopsis arenosa TaxID=1240361 RepID=A0A8T2B505_9BRAS|nr:hypothetical protein ISN45_Aa03g032340 [Arabidopsis thaliana x Arabidopsis arenosa]